MPCFYKLGCLVTMLLLFIYEYKVFYINKLLLKLTNVTFKEEKVLVGQCGLPKTLMMNVSEDYTCNKEKNARVIRTGINLEKKKYNSVIYRVFLSYTIKSWLENCPIYSVDGTMTS